MEVLVVIIFFFASLAAALIVFVQVEKRRYQAEHARFQASLNSINVGFMITDTDSRVIMINTAAKQIVFNQDKTGSPAILRNSPKAHFSYSIEEIQSQLGTAFDLKGQIYKVLSDKTTISQTNIPFGQLYLHIFITPTVILGGPDKLELEQIGAVVLIEDITQQILLNRSKDEFFSIASHELRTPLTAIRGNTALMEQYYSDKLQDPNLKEMVHDIHESSMRLINIVNDFLDVSRLEQGRIEYHNATFGILGLAKEVAKELSPLAAQKNIYLKVDEPQEAPPIVFADKERIKQVLFNLIGNALKFTTQGGITVRFTLDGNFVKCSVIDTGKGIPEQNQKLLFRKFQQAGSNILTRDVSGTGLGLYISKLMVEGQGGRIYLEYSQEGKGAVFSFTLPIAPLAQAPTSTGKLTSVGQT